MSFVEDSELIGPLASPLASPLVLNVAFVKQALETTGADSRIRDIVMSSTYPLCIKVNPLRSAKRR